MKQELKKFRKEVEEKKYKITKMKFIVKITLRRLDPDANVVKDMKNAVVKVSK